MAVRTPQPASRRPYGASSSAVRVHCSTNHAHVITSYGLRVLAEHVGLIPPMTISSRREHVTSFMRPAPVPNDDETDLEEDACVADPLSDRLLNLWNTTARVNREVFTELFRPVPSNLVHNWNAYNVSIGRRRFHGLDKLPSYSCISLKSKLGTSFPGCRSIV